VIPFCPYSKSQLTVTRVKKDDDKVRVVLKGAPDVVINHCSTAMKKYKENPVPFDEDEKVSFINSIYGLDSK
jgi:magnesium-transporting ATPase (P-type)